MQSRFLAALAAVAFAAAPAAAQIQDNFRFQNIHAGAPAIDGAYIGPYIGAFDGSNNYGTSFDVWCVDYAHQMTFGDTYNVWITPIDGSDFTHTRLGSALGYEWSAVLANQMDWLSIPGDVAGNDPAIQDAIWVLMGGTTSNLVASGKPLSTYLKDFGSTLSLSTGWFTAAPNSTVYADWSIITCDPGLGVTGAPNPVSSCPFQEFIYRGTPGSRTETVVPEPVTMSLLATGLAGMALANRKRRRNTA